MKTCSKCNETKEVDAFSKHKSAKEGLRGQCRGCCKADNAKHYAANSEKCIARVSAWQKENAEKVRAGERARYAADPSKKDAANAKWRAANIEHCLALSKTYGKANAATRDARSSAWAAANPNKRKMSAQKWRQANKGSDNAIQAKRRAAKLQQSPSWADNAAIEALYSYKRLLQNMIGVELHIDHIVPLINDKVRGLHVAGNLQILPAVLNHSKNNTYEVAV